MKLLTKEILASLPPLGGQQEIDDPIAYVRFFTPDAGWEWYVTEGGGVLVTGGTLTDPTESAPGEIRATGLAGGYERKIAKGDFVRIPAGVPHWVHKIDGKEIVYLIVKVPRPK